MMHRLCQLFGSGFVCDPAGIIRDQGGKFMPDKFMQSRHSLKQVTSSDKVSFFRNGILF